MCYIDYPNFPGQRSTNPYDNWNHWNTPRNVKKTTKTIEKFDEKGNLVSREVITTEEEVTDQTPYPPTYPEVWYTISSDSTGNMHNRPSTTNHVQMRVSA